MATLRLAHALPLLALIAGCNDVPEGAVVGINPEVPTTADDLMAVIITDAIDKQPLTYSYAWSVDGEASTITDPTIPAADTTKGQVWSVVVTPNDGKVDGVTAQASVTIANTAPTASVTIEPSAPSTLDELVATPVSDDIDEDAVTLEWSWTRDGIGMPNDANAIPAADTKKGQVWQVTVSPTDGEIVGVPATATVTIANEPPVADIVSLQPFEVYAATVIEALALGADPDGDKLTWTYTWYVSGGEVQSGASNTLAGVFSKNDEVQVEAVASDGSTPSNLVRSGVVTVLNTAPLFEDAMVSPSAPTSDSVLSCIPSGAYDIDDDSITYTTSWNVNGREIGEFDTIDSASFNKAQLVTCTVTPYDGEAYGDPVISAAVEVLNTAPTLASVSIGPSGAKTVDNLTITLTGAFDLDGDPITYTYDWTIGGVSVSTASTLAASNHKKADLVSVAVTPNDGEDDGPPVSATITIKNTAPTAPDVEIDPTGPADADDLLCDVITDSTDADGDRLTYTVTWTLDGSTWTGSTYTSGITGDTISESDTGIGDEWSCSITASDGTDTSTAGLSSTATVRDRDGQVRKVDGTWIDVDYEACGTGSSCNATQAKAACTAIGKKVVSHASDGTTSVSSLGATISCGYATSYFTVDSTMATSDCLVGVSNLDWTSCCTTARWHGNTMAFGASGAVFGYGYSGASGYVSTYPNVSGALWGCSTPSTAATVPSGCTTAYVACTK